ncbi:O-acyltransferase like protein-like [Lycorma delicatula]|uniref:O-acyltransferase like protein-like n=1 Tax=Lycorma delicatula TaxID=130591 RepID=UPI003F5155FA
MCQAIEDKSPITKFSFFVAVLFFGLIFLLCLIATLLEPILMKRSSSDNLLVSFSFYKNWKILMNTNQNPNDITSIDGIRFMSAVSLLLSHKQMALMFLPYINRTHMAEITGVAWTTIGRTAILHTDTFIFLSGFLSAKSLFADLEKSNKIYLKQSVISRFIRLTPNLFAVIIFSTWILPNVNWGPLWPQVITTHSDLCKRNFWRNLFYIHNFFPFEEMCLTHTHQLGIDMQLYLSSFLLIFLLWNFQKFGIILMIFIASVSTYFRYATTVTYNLSSIVHYGISISRLMKTANYSYIRPSHRMTVYIMGILLSYFLHIKKNKILLSKVQVFLGWILFLSFGLLTVVGPFSTGLIDYTYYAFDAAIYSSFAPILWCSFVSWGLITSHYGFAGWFGSFLSWKGFKIFTKISYAVYLTQFPIFFYNVGTKRTSSFYSPFDMFNIGELSCIIFVSVLLTLMFDIPFQNVQKILWPKNVEGLCARNSDKMINYNVYHDANREEEIAREVVTVRQRNIRSHG